MTYNILAINPGSTSTKIALFEDDKQVFIKTIRHTAEEIGKFPNISSQFSFRKELILSELKQAGIEIGKVHAIVGRGGLIKPIESGVYEVNPAMLHDLEVPVMGEHASNLGGLIAYHLARELGPEVKAFMQTAGSFRRKRTVSVQCIVGVNHPALFVGTDRYASAQMCNDQIEFFVFPACRLGMHAGYAFLIQGMENGNPGNIRMSADAGKR